MKTSKQPSGRTRPAPASKKGSKKPPAKRTSRREVGLLVGLTVLLAVILVPRLSSGSDIPTELSGHWTTDDARYADRSLVITDSTVAFYMGADPITVHRVRRTHTKPDDFGGVQYDIEYKSEGGSQSISLIYETSPTEIIRLKNQPDMEWMKAGSD
jgi:hypothetical protein